MTKLFLILSLFFTFTQSFADGDYHYFVDLTKASNDKLTITLIPPDLTENEKRLCSLLLLKFSSKEIAGILNISIAGVNKSRQRLRKKMELDPQADFAQFFGN